MKICTSLSAPKKVVISQPASKKQPKNIFFSDLIPISELHQLAEIQTIPEENDHVLELKSWERSQKTFERWSSKSTSGIPSDPAKFHLELKALKRVKIITPENIRLTPPPPGFSEKGELKVSPEKKKRWVDFSSDSDLSGNPLSSSIRPIAIPVSKSEVILKPPPSKPSLVKREKRSTFENEFISDEFFVGKVKFYHLKKRHGFISLEGSDDVFLVEDELVLSGIVLRKFKDDVYNKKEKILRFKIKTRTDNGKIKKIATNIEIIS
jgi:hypothetical protein